MTRLLLLFTPAPCLFVAPVHTSPMFVCCSLRRMLRAVGVTVADPTPATFNRLHVELWPRVSWTPAFAQVHARHGAVGCRSA